MRSTHDLSGDGGSAFHSLELIPHVQPEGAHALNEMEEQLRHQRQLLTEAAKYLHEAAYLARYHQPALERHIRAFLDQLDA